MNDKQQMLAAMLAGKKTKESEAISQISNKVEGKPVKPITESVLPSATELNVTKQDAMMGTMKALPPVSKEDLEFLLGGQKGPRPSERTKPQQQLIQETQVPLKKYGVDDEDRFDDVDMIAALQAKKKLQFVNNGTTPASTVSGGRLNESIDMSSLKRIVEEMVYEVLSEIVEDANQNLANKEQIKIMIGESLFVGNIQKALTMPDKK